MDGLIGETTTKVKEKAGCREEGWSRICRIGKGEDSLFKRAMLALSLGLEDEISGSVARAGHPEYGSLSSAQAKKKARSGSPRIW